jgi:hypothetical protein
MTPISFEPPPGSDPEHDAYRKRVDDFRERRVRECDHDFQPVSMVFETQMLDGDGRVLVRQPDLARGRVYCVCMKCHGHTYAETRWVGYYLADGDDPVQGSSDDEDEAAATSKNQRED